MAESLTLEKLLSELPGRGDWDSAVSQEDVLDLLQKARGKIVENGWWHPHKKNQPTAITLSDGLVFAYLEPFCGQKHDGDKRVIINAYRALAATMECGEVAAVIWDADDSRTETDVFNVLDRTIAASAAKPRMPDERL